MRPTSSRKAGLDGYIAKQAIANVLALHSRGVDRADRNLLASAYHEDATVDYGPFKGPAQQLAAAVPSAQRGQPVTLHRTSNRYIAVEGDSARSESYVIAYLEQLDGGAAVQRLVGGRYLDRHARRDGQWRIAHRQYVMDWNTNRPSSASWPEPSADFTHFLPRGAQGATDPGRALLTLGAAGFSRKGAHAVARTADEAELDAALSRQALDELCAAYARGVDRADAQLLASLFNEDSTVISGVINGSGPEFARDICAFVTSNLERCFHSISNSWFEIEGDAAVGEIYVIAMATAGGQDIMTGGRYVDSYQRRSGAWKFSSRTFVMDWSTTQPSSYQRDGMYASLTMRGCFGRQDPVYAFWKT
jgi:hypothetical protein